MAAYSQKTPLNLR